MLRSPVVVGRSRELGEIRRALDRACTGEGGCLFVVGEAGSGKTRLLAEARVEARRRSMTFLGGNVPPAVTSPPFGAVTQAVRFWGRNHPLPVEELSPFALGLHQVLPEWPPPADPPDLSAGQIRLLVLEGLLRLLLVASRGTGALVMLDDRH